MAVRFRLPCFAVACRRLGCTRIVSEMAQPEPAYASTPCAAATSSTIVSPREPSCRLAGRAKRVGPQRRQVVLRPRDIGGRHLLIRDVASARPRRAPVEARGIRRRVLLTDLPLAELRRPLRFGPRERAPRVLHAVIFPCASVPTAHRHQLLRSFRLPDVFVGAAPLHAHGLADRARLAAPHLQPRHPSSSDRSNRRARPS